MSYAGLRLPGIRHYAQTHFFTDANRAVLLKKGENVPLGTRVSTKINKELRYQGFIRLAMVSKGLV